MTKSSSRVDRVLSLLERFVEAFEQLVASNARHGSELGRPASSDKPKPPPSVPSTSVQPTELDRARARRIAQEMGMVKR